jgi:hypothetical protein
VYKHAKTYVDKMFQAWHRGKCCSPMCQRDLIGGPQDAPLGLSRLPKLKESR